jgi:hypothetical protein
MQSLIWPEKKGLFGGRTFSDYMFFIEELQSACLPGDTVAFWEDIINGALQSVTFPNLVGYAKDPKASLWKLRNEGNLINCFNIPMSRAAYNEYLLLHQYFDSLPSPDLCENDSWKFIWGQ